MIYNDNTSSFTDLLDVDNSVSMHQRNILVLATELYKFVNGLMAFVNCFELNNMTCITLETGPLLFLGQFAQSYMAQNHSSTCDQKFGNFCQVI